MIIKNYKCICGLLLIIVAACMPQYVSAQTQLRISGITANNKVYDGLTSASVTIDSVSGVVAGDDVAVSALASYADNAAGTNKVVNVSFSLSGADAVNYLAPSDTVLYAEIIPKQLIVYGYALGHKIYDGDISCPVLLPGNLSGVIGTDQVSFSAEASFADKNAGTGKSVTIHYQLSGTYAANYYAPNDVISTSYITPLQVYCDTVVVASSKEYDGSDSCVVDSAGSLIGMILGDSVSLNVAASFVDGPSVGSNKLVVVSYNLSGEDSVNYTVKPDTCYSDINARVINISGITVAGKIYDGLTTCQITDTGSATNIVVGDTVSYTVSAAFVDPLAGEDKPAFVTVAISGPDVYNYALPDSLFAYADITPKQLIIYGQLLQPAKIYDGTDICPVMVNGFLSGLIGSDQVSHTLDAHFYNRHVGNNKTVTVSVMLMGPDSANYLAPTSYQTAADILPLQLLVDSTVLDTAKIYDGTVLCGVSYAGNMLNVAAIDAVSISAAATFGDCWVGNDKPVIVSYTLHGPNSGNYLAPEADSSLTSSIFPKQLAVTVTIIDTTKVYDSHDYCSVSNVGTLSGALSGDTVVLDANATYDTPWVGYDKSVTIVFSLSGAQAFNYLAPDPVYSVASVTPRQLGADGVEVILAKTYDGNDTAIVSRQPNATNVASADNGLVGVFAVALYDSPDAGHGKTISVCYTAIGSRASNYFAPETEIFSTNGAIILPTVFDTTSVSNPVSDPDEGTCQNEDVILTVSLLQGEPVEYMLDFEDSIFIDVTSWTPFNADGTICFALPANCPSGVYNVDVTLRDEAHYTTTPLRTQFVVNFPESRILQVFNDVVSVDNRDGIFTAFQWYHNGEIIQGAERPYYQDPAGLSGSYSVKVTLADGQQRNICEWTDIAMQKTNKSVKLYPNPVFDCLNVNLDGFDDIRHVLVVYDSYGRVVLRREFEGDDFSVGMASVTQGSYVVVVDGVASKIVKR